MTRCLRCRLRVERCLCASIPRIETRTQIVILRHRMERHKPSNSARLAALALPRCSIIDYGMGVTRGASERSEGSHGAHSSPGFAGRDRPLTIDEAALAAPGTWLLWPDGDTAPAAAAIGRLLVLDGSWPQARRMFQRIPALRGLPRLALAAPARPPARLRRQRLAEGMATIEAIARAIELIEGPAAAAPLDALYAEFVSRSMPLTGGRASRTS